VLTGLVIEAANEKRQGLTLRSLEEAIRSSWSVDTCDPTDVAVWAPSNPSRGQCAVTALVVNDFFGGQLLEAEVHYPDGSRQGFHYWNRLSGVDIDLTREQFTSEEVVQESRVIERQTGGPWLAHDQYLVFRERVLSALEKRAGGQRTSEGPEARP
jgi:hypothetical protein